MVIAERGSRRGVRETDQPGFVDHPDRLDDTLKYRCRQGLAGQRRRLADTIGRSSSLSDPRAANLLGPRVRLYGDVPLRARYQEHLPQFCANALTRGPVAAPRTRPDYGKLTRLGPKGLARQAATARG